MAGKNRAKNSVFIDKTGETLTGTGHVQLTKHLEDYATHLETEMPHQFKDLDNNKTYRYGLAQKDGYVTFIYEEVV